MVRMLKLWICYMDTDSFIVHAKTEDIYKDIAEDFGKRFDTSNYEVDRMLIGLIKNELEGQILKKFVGLRAKTYSYLKENNDGDKKLKVSKNVS